MTLNGSEENVHVFAEKKLKLLLTVMNLCWHVMQYALFTSVRERKRKAERERDRERESPFCGMCSGECLHNRVENLLQYKKKKNNQTLINHF